MPTARSRLADIEGAGLGMKLFESEITDAIGRLKEEVSRFLVTVEANRAQRDEFRAGLADLIADATARQLREIKEGEE